MAFSGLGALDDEGQAGPGTVQPDRVLDPRQAVRLYLGGVALLRERPELAPALTTLFGKFGFKVPTDAGDQAVKRAVDDFHGAFFAPREEELDDATIQRLLEGPISARFFEENPLLKQEFDALVERRKQAGGGAFAPKGSPFPLLSPEQQRVERARFSVSRLAWLLEQGLLPPGRIGELLSLPGGREAALASLGLRRLVGPSVGLAPASFFFGRSPTPGLSALRPEFSSAP
jgi:hypothetical protein